MPMVPVVEGLACPKLVRWETQSEIYHWGWFIGPISGDFLGWFMALGLPHSTSSYMHMESP